jgi:hypothetical protein
MAMAPISVVLDAIYLLVELLISPQRVVMKAGRRRAKDFVQPHLKSGDFKSGCKHEGVFVRDAESYIGVRSWMRRGGEAGVKREKEKALVRSRPRYRTNR